MEIAVRELSEGFLCSFYYCDANERCGPPCLITCFRNLGAWHVASASPGIAPAMYMHHSTEVSDSRPTTPAAPTVSTVSAVLAVEISLGLSSVRLQKRVPVYTWETAGNFVTCIGKAVLTWFYMLSPRRPVTQPQHLVSRSVMPT